MRYNVSVNKGSDHRWRESKMKRIERPNESIYDVMQEFYVGCVYPTDGDSFFSCSNIPSEYEAIPVYCEDGMFFAFMTQWEIHRYEEIYEKRRK